MAADAPITSPVVFERDGVALTSSRDVADLFGKRHDHVIRDIENISPDLGASLDWFRRTTRTDTYGRAQPAYELTRDGLALLVMGYTGTKARTFQVAYIERFNAMEAALRSRSLPPSGPRDLTKAETKAINERAQSLIAAEMRRRFDEARAAIAEAAREVIARGAPLDVAALDVAMPAPVRPEPESDLPADVGCVVIEGERVFFDASHRAVRAGDLAVVVDLERGALAVERLHGFGDRAQAGHGLVERPCTTRGMRAWDQVAIVGRVIAAPAPRVSAPVVELDWVNRPRSSPRRLPGTAPKLMLLAS